MRNFTHISLEVEGDLDAREDVVEPKRGSRPKLILKRKLDEYTEGGAAFEHAATIDLETVRMLTHHIIRHVELPESHALTERRAAHIQSVLQIGVERIKNILRER